MTCWVDWSRWNRGHPVFFLSWAIPLTQVVMRVMLVSHGGGDVPRRHTKWTERWALSDVGRFFVTGSTDVETKPSYFYCRICRKDVSMLTHGHHQILRHFQVPRQHTLSAWPTFAVGNARLGTAWLCGECHESSRGRAPARKNHEGSFGCERQGVPILRRRHC